VGERGKKRGERILGVDGEGGEGVVHICNCNVLNDFNPTCGSSIDLVDLVDLVAS